MTPPPHENRSLTALSAWMLDYVKSWGSYLDTLESAKYVQTFKDDPMFIWNDYIEPPSGFLTFNQFFARHVRPGRRPIDGITDPRVIVSPTDSTFVGSWDISEDSAIHLEKVLHLKGLKWSIAELLQNSPYKDAFKGGIFSHSFLNVNDYHRFHSPVEGRVLEARLIKGQVNCGVEIVQQVKGVRKINILEAVDETGFQFVQMRGLMIIDSPIGLVACLPVGMSLISSIIFTAEEGVNLRKGEEIGYFQAGGSDFVLVFQKQSKIELSWKKGMKSKQGEAIGRSQRQSSI
eukprot:g7267.t1